jgi:acyl-ACP thioesterase
VNAPGLGLVPPGPGRRFTASRLVRLGDVLPSGEARLDAIARYLQDIATDDGRDAGIDTDLAWLVRKTLIALNRRPLMGERLDMETWASGSGARWAERRTTLSVDGQPVVEAASLWVCVDLATLRPARLPARFWSMYGDAVDGRTVSSRLTHPDLPVATLADRRPWPLRISDLDVLGHVNNAMTWAAVEDELDRIGLSRAVIRAELEYRGPIDRSHATVVASQVTDNTAHVWLAAADSVLASAALTFSQRSSGNSGQ